jgi:hypothetical protein
VLGPADRIESVLEGSSTAPLGRSSGVQPPPLTPEGAPISAN